MLIFIEHVVVKQPTAWTVRFHSNIEFTVDFLSVFPISEALTEDTYENNHKEEYFFYDFLQSLGKKEVHVYTILCRSDCIFLTE